MKPGRIKVSSMIAGTTGHLVAVSSTHSFSFRASRGWLVASCGWADDWPLLILMPFNLSVTEATDGRFDDTAAGAGVIVVTFVWEFDNTMMLASTSFLSGSCQDHARFVISAKARLFHPTVKRCWALGLRYAPSWRDPAPRPRRRHNRGVGCAQWKSCIWAHLASLPG